MDWHDEAKKMVATKLGIEVMAVRSETAVTQDVAVEVCNSICTSWWGAELKNGWPDAQPLTFWGIVGILRHAEGLYLNRSL